jgi:hypothetical protein
MTVLNFFAEKHACISTLTSQVTKRDPNPYFTFVFTREHIHLIGGQTEHLSMVTLDNDTPFEETAWSISASAFACFWAGQHTHIANEAIITLELNVDKKHAYPTLDGITEHHSYRYVTAQPACDAHRHFFDNVMTTNYHRIDTSKAQKICALADEHRPFQAIEVNKARNEVVIERDGILLPPRRLPDDLSVDFNMVLTPEAKNGLQTLAHTTSCDTLSVSLDDEQAIFSDGEQVFSYSLAALRGYRDKQQQHFTQEAKMVIDIFTFKKELEAFQKIAEIKKANQVLLYLTPAQIYLASMHPITGSVKSLSQKEIITSNEQLYSINLNALSKVPLKDITTAKEIKVTVQHSVHGELKLGFHNDKNKDFSYYSVPIEAANSLLPELKRFIERAQLIDAPHFGEQIDMLGFDDV